VLYTYSQLKALLEIRPTLQLMIFEKYCRSMLHNTRVLEWSCKLVDGTLEGARFLHTSLHRDFKMARQAVDGLYENLIDSGFLPSSQGEFFMSLAPLAEKLAGGVALGYAERKYEDPTYTELKFYVSTDQVKIIEPIIEKLIPPEAIPPRSTTRLMVAASIDGRKRSRSRVYYLWNREHFKRDDVSRWMSRWLSPEEIELTRACNSETVSLAFKDCMRDMLYLSVPFEMPKLQRWIASSTKDYHIPYSQLGNLRWVGLSKSGEALKSKEMNLYYNCVFV